MCFLVQLWWFWSGENLELILCELKCILTDCLSGHLFSTQSLCSRKKTSEKSATVVHEFQTKTPAHLESLIWHWKLLLCICWNTNCRMKHRWQDSISCLHSTEIKINLHRYYGIAASILTLCNLNWVAQPVTYNLQHLWFRRYDICMQSWKSKSEIAMSFGIPEYLQHTLNHGPNDTLKQAFCSPDSQS